MPEPSRIEHALTVEDLSVTFRTGNARGAVGGVNAVDGVSFAVDPGRVLAVVGESGSGKSATALATLGLLPDSATVTGRALVGGRDMVAMKDQDREGMRGQEIAMVFQDALSALNPYRTIGRQITDAYLLHHPGASARTAKARSVEMLGLVGMPEPARRAGQYPHEFSGGMRQRAMIATAIVNDPRVLVADEPTTALDVTVQAQVLDLLLRLTDELGMAMVLITHDLGVVAQTADDVLVMYAGRVAEQGSVVEVFDHPTHPYTLGLHETTPDAGFQRTRLRAISGVPASGTDRPHGCAFHPRCPFAEEVGAPCRETQPPLVARLGDPAHLGACHLPTDRALR